MKTTNDIKIYDTEKVFELNPNMKIEVSYLGSNKLPLLVIDDFYKNPELIRDLLISSPVPSITSSSNGGFPGKRVKLCSFVPRKFQQEYSNILRKYLKLDFHLEHAENAFLGNVFDASGAADKFNNSTPHMDPAVIASIIYLNNDDEKVGGTSVYEHRESGLNFIPASRFHFEWISHQKAKHEDKTISEAKEELDKKFRQYRDKIFAQSSDTKEKRDTHVLKSNDEWEILATVESKFNRLAGYIGGTLHSAMIDFDELSKKPYKRINQVVFMDMLRR